MLQQQYTCQLPICDFLECGIVDSDHPGVDNVINYINLEFPYNDIINKPIFNPNCPINIDNYNDIEPFTVLCNEYGTYNQMILLANNKIEELIYAEIKGQLKLKKSDMKLKRKRIEKTLASAKLPALGADGELIARTFDELLKLIDDLSNKKFSQRALLYLGAKQNQCEDKFEDMVLDPKPYINSNGIEYKGLLAMLANRMKYQRGFYGYDLFISASDLDREAEDFVGLTRRYLAAAEPE